jgi:two-component sensor histidine kinase
MIATQRTILYIDDDEGLRRLTRRALERAGYRVMLASGGAEGVAMAELEPVDLVAVDHYMPGMDGLATLAALQELPSPPPVLYVTGSDESRLAVAALKAGAIDYVVKTVDEDFFALLANTIEQTLATADLRRQKERAEALLKESNARLQALLQEVNHRVANSLQLVSSFVHMQSRNLADEGARAALADTQRRISAIAQVHRRLYTSASVEQVDMADYLAQLIDELSETYATGDGARSISITAEPIRIATDKAVAIGIVVNELVTNACKYAYPADVAGAVRIGFGAFSPNEYRLYVEDDGCGMSDGVQPQGTGLGSKLIGAMAASLHAAFHYVPRQKGVRAELIGNLL